MCSIHLLAMSGVTLDVGVSGCSGAVWCNSSLSTGTAGQVGRMLHTNSTLHSLEFIISFEGLHMEM